LSIMVFPVRDEPAIAGLEQSQDLFLRIGSGFDFEKVSGEIHDNEKEALVGIVVTTMRDLIEDTGMLLSSLGVCVEEGSGVASLRAFWDPKDRNRLVSGIIVYKTAYLSALIEKLNTEKDFLNMAELSVMQTTAHEMYHFKGAKRRPRRWKRTAKLVTDLNGVEDPREELAADMYSLRYMSQKVQANPRRYPSGYTFLRNLRRQIRSQKKR